MILTFQIASYMHLFHEHDLYFTKTLTLNPQCHKKKVFNSQVNWAFDGSSDYVTNFKKFSS